MGFRAAFLGMLVTGVLLTPLRAQQLALSVHLEKATYAEDEPIYAVYELANPGPDTVWIEPFGEPQGTLHPHLLGLSGKEVVGLGFSADMVVMPGWHGDPVAPHASVFQVVLLQDRWGNYHEGSSPTVFIRHLPPGAYRLTGTFSSRVGQQPRIEVVHQDVQFSIRPATPAERAAFEELRQFCIRARQRGQGRPMFNSWLAWASNHQGDEAAKSLIPFLLHNGVQIAKAWGNWPDSLSTLALDSGRVRFASAHSNSPSGAYAVEAMYADNPILAQPVASELRGSLAGQVGAEREAKYHGHQRRP